MAFTRDDVVKDTPTNTFATLNSLSKSNTTLTKGNLYATTSGNNASFYNTMKIPKTGKWIVEFYKVTGDAHFCIDTIDEQRFNGYDPRATGILFWLYYSTNTTSTNRYVMQNNPAVAMSSTWPNGQTGSYVYTVFFDRDNNQIKVYADNQHETVINLTGDFIGKELSIGHSVTTTWPAAQYVYNFGQDPTFANNKIPSKVYTDASGYGRFFYEPPAGAMALCTANLDTANLQPAEYIVDETNQHMLTYNGNAKISKFSPYATDGWSINFNGINQYLYLNKQAFDFGTGDFSFECFVYVKGGDNSNYQVLLDTRTGAAAENLVLGLTPNNTLYWYSGSEITGTEKVPPFKWTHILFARSGSTLKMYVNGKESYSATNTGNFNASNTTYGYLGKAIQGVGWVAGYITEIRSVIGSCAYDISGSAITIPTSFLSVTTNTKLLISANNRQFLDTSTNNYDIFPVDGPSISDWSPYQRSNDFDTAFLRAKDNYYGGSFYFDGNGDYLSNNDVEFYLDENDNGSSSTPSNFSFNFWTYLTDLSAQYRVFFSKYGVSWSYQLFWDQTNKRFWFNINSSGSTTNLNLYFNYPTGLNINQWYHISFRREGTGTTSSTYKLYLDGIQIGGNQTDNGKINRNGSSSPFRIGTTAGGTENILYQLSGYIADFQLKKGAQDVYLPFSESTTPPSTKISSDANTKLLLQPWHTKTSAGVMSLIDSYAQDETGKSLTYYDGATIIDSFPYKGSNFGSFSLDGVSQYVFTPDHADFNLSSNDFTIEQWVKFRDLTENTLLNQSIGGAASDSAFIFWMANGGSLAFYLTTGTGWDKNTSGYTMSANVWYHVAAVRNGNSLDLYVNGNKVGTTTDVTGYVVGNSTRRLQIGAQESSMYLNGIVTDARIVNGQALYTTDFIPPAYPLSTTHYTTDGTDPATSSTKQSITGTVPFLTQPGAVTKRNNVAAQDPDAYMKSVIYTGQTTADAGTWDSGTSTSTIAVGFQPDLVWLKGRNYAEHHSLVDSVRGASSLLQVNRVYGESPTTQHILSIGSTDFTIGTNHEVNNANSTFVAWCWKAGGAPSGDGVAMVDGSATTCSALATSSGASITPTRMSVNTKAGFSIVQYLSTGVAGDTIPHGLNSKPDFIIFKNLDHSNDWAVYHSKTGGSQKIFLNLTNQSVSSGIFNNTEPTNTVISLGQYGSGGETNGITLSTNGVGQNYIAYCWHSVPGYSAFGSYTGNSSADGTFVYTGFKPAWVMVKATNLNGSSWFVWDNQRSPHNEMVNALLPNDPMQELTDREMDFLSNGFKPRANDGNYNQNYTYIYMAFAEQPGKYSNAR